MNVIFNADDFGYCEGQNKGIIKCHQEGVLTSATLMMNMDATEHAIQLARQNPDLKVGIHVVLTTGYSILNHKELTDKKGHFFRKLLYGDLTDEQVSECHKEIDAQINLFLKSGLELSHIDSHHHVHYHPKLYPYFEKKAFELGVPLRKNVSIDTKELYGHPYETQYDLAFHKSLPDFTMDFYDEGVTMETLKKILTSYETVEVMCHPAVVDEFIMSNTSYNLKRGLELELLCSDELKTFIKENDVNLSTY